MQSFIVKLQHLNSKFVKTLLENLIKETLNFHKYVKVIQVNFISRFVLITSESEILFLRVIMNGFDLTNYVCQK